MNDPNWTKTVSSKSENTKIDLQAILDHATEEAWGIVESKDSPGDPMSHQYEEFLEAQHHVERYVERSIIQAIALAPNIDQTAFREKTSAIVQNITSYLQTADFSNDAINNILKQVNGLIAETIKPYVKEGPDVPPHP